MSQSQAIIDWDDPTARFHLVERVGIQEYNRLFQENWERTIVSTVNGYDIRPVGSMFGRLFMICGTNQARSSLPDAEKYARSLPAGPSA